MAPTNRVQRGCLVTSGRCPVLLMRSGILRKGLPAQWQTSNFSSNCRGKYLFFLVIYLLQLDGVNSRLLTVAPFVGPDSCAYCCALRGTRWHSCTLVVMLLPPYIAVTFRHGVSLVTSFVTVYCMYKLCRLGTHLKGWHSAS